MNYLQINPMCSSFIIQQYLKFPLVEETNVRTNSRLTHN